MSNFTENLLYKPILEFFNPEFDTFAEVYFSRRRVDLVFVKDEKANLIIAVELKVNDWRSGLRQAVTNQLFADQSYVAVARKKNNKQLSSQAYKWFRKSGIGLIFVLPDEVKIIIQSERSEYIIPDQRASILMLLNDASVNHKTTQEELENGNPAKPPRKIAFLPAGTY